MDANIAWTVAIAVNLARRQWRRLTIGKRVLARLEGQSRSGVSSLDVEAVSRVDTYRRLVSLPRRQREIATLWVLGDMTAEEIADVLGISASAVRTHMQRIRRRLTTGGAGDPQPETRDAWS